MEEIIKDLKEIATKQLEICKENKTIPSKGVLDIVNIIKSYHFFQSNV